MKRKFTQLTYEERIQIESLTREGFSCRHVATVLKRSPNTISRELQMRKVKNIYTPKKAQHKAYLKRYLSKRDCMKVSMDEYLCRFVKEKLECRWSPERIAGYLKTQGLNVSTKAIYKYTYTRALDHNLFWRRHRKRGARKQYAQSIQSERRFIGERPPLTGSGHLEADFIVSSNSTWCLLVVVDRHTRYVWVERIPNRKHVVVTRAFQRIIGNMSVKTITIDNDIAFSGWKQLEHILHTTIYFCHPYHSWEKGLVENTNRWIRCFVPKRKDVGSVTEKELHDMQTFLNTVPRKILGFKSASEVHLREVRVS